MILPEETFSSDFAAEETRIAQAYLQRDATIPTGRYSRLNRGQLLIMQAVERSLVSLLKRQNISCLQDQRILDIGCGVGDWLRTFIGWGARPDYLCGIDLREDVVSEARKLLPQSVLLRAGNATRLEFESASFDLVCQFTVFSSVLDPQMRRQVASEMLRLLKPRGHIVWFDLCVNNPWNPDVRSIRKAEIRALFPGCRLRLQRLTLIAPVAHVAPLIIPLTLPIKLLCTHYLVLIEKIQT